MENSKEQQVSVNGRVSARRIHKTCSFVDVETPEETIQLLLQPGAMLPQLGDIVSAMGTAGMTKSG